ncbi:cyclin-like protein interacting with PHO85, partial [Coemansia sp. RSA 2559]
MFDIEHTPLATTVGQAGKLIDAVIAANHASIGTITTDITPFHSRTVPSISAHDYMYRVSKYVGLENDAALAVLVYLDRVTRAQINRPSMALSPYNIHRLILSAIVVAHKFHSDIFLNNLRYSKVGGVPLAELNQLELEFLFLIKFDLKVDSAELQNLGEWLMSWSGGLAHAAPLSTLGSYSTCVLSQYYDEGTMECQADLYRQHISSLMEGSGIIPMASPVANSLASTMTMPPDTDDIIAHSVVSNGSNSAVSYVEMQHLSPNAVVEKLATRKQSSRRHQQASHERSPLELTTPSSTNTVCAPATPPMFREYPCYEIDYGAVASDDVYGGSIATSRLPHVAFGLQRLQHSGGVRLSNGSDHQKWGMADMA